VFFFCCVLARKREKSQKSRQTLRFFIARLPPLQLKCKNQETQRESGFPPPQF
jgi:hypothetical protein